VPVHDAESSRRVWRCCICMQRHRERRNHQVLGLTAAPLNLLLFELLHDIRLSSYHQGSETDCPSFFSGFPADTEGT
jgi:hypothetical protein